MSKISSMRTAFSKDEEEKILDNMTDALERGFVADGPYTDFLKEAMLDITSGDECVFVSSVTSGLNLISKVLSKRKGTIPKWIMPANSWISNPSAIYDGGGDVCFCDISTKTLMPTEEMLDEAKEKMGGVDVVIVPILLGLEGLFSVRKWCDRNSAYLIEDSSQAIFTSTGDVSAGEVGDISLFSFGPMKFVRSGAGGAIIAHGDMTDLVQRVKMMAYYGRPNAVGGREVYELPMNTRFNELSAAITYATLKKFPIQKQRALANRYAEQLGGIVRGEGERWTFYKLLCFPTNHRNRLTERLNEVGVKRPTGCWEYNLPKKLKPHMKFEMTSLPHAKDWRDRNFALPCYPELSFDDVDMICEIVKEYG